MLYDLYTSLRTSVYQKKKNVQSYLPSATFHSLDYSVFYMTFQIIMYIMGGDF